MTAISPSLKRRLAVVCIGILAIAFFFRASIGSRFTLLFGEPYDGNILVAILEHWRWVARGAARWNSVGYFYPHADTLGYNDGYLLYGVLYTPLRFLGCDPYIAAEIVNMIVKYAGYISMFLFLQFLGFAVPLAVLGAILFTIANNSLVQGVHAQLFSVAFAPLQALLVLRFAERAERRRNAVAAVYGIAAALLYAAWLLTAFYTSWFFGLFTILLTLFALPQRATFAARPWRILAGWPAAVAALLLVAGLVPFLAVYLPKAQETGMHSFTGILDLVPRPADLLNVGDKNIIWAPVWRGLQTVFGGPQFGEGESVIGFPPLLLSCALAGIVQSLRAPNPFWRATACALILSGVLVLRVGDGSAWWLVYSFVPGGRAVRVVARYAIFLAFPVTLMAMRGLQPVRRPAILAILAALLVLEEANAALPNFLNRQEGLAVLAAVPPPPASCQSFAVINRRLARLNGSPALDALYHHNVDAMLIAAATGLPTVNGFSTFQPRDWNFSAPARPDYAARLATYAAMHGIGAGLCRLDLVQHRWILP